MSSPEVSVGLCRDRHPDGIVCQLEAGHRIALGTRHTAAISGPKNRRGESRFDVVRW